MATQTVIAQLSACYPAATARYRARTRCYRIAIRLLSSAQNCYREFLPNCDKVLIAKELPILRAERKRYQTHPRKGGVRSGPDKAPNNRCEGKQIN